MATIAVVIGATVIALLIRTTALRIDRLSDKLALLVDVEYPAFTPDAIDHARRRIDSASNELQARSNAYRAGNQHAREWADCVRWHELQKADLELLQARETLDFFVASNAAVRAGTKTLTHVRNEYDDLQSAQSWRVSDYLLEMNVYDLLVLERGVKYSKLLNGHKLLIKCSRCEQQTTRTAEQLRDSPRTSCDSCGAELDKSASMFVHPDHATRLGRVAVEWDDAG